VQGPFRHFSAFRVIETTREFLIVGMATTIQASAFAPILLQKSKVASVRIFGETLKREVIDDSDNLSRVTKVAYEFSVRR